MKKVLFIVFILSAFNLFAQPEQSKIAGKPGAFSRLGFGAEGIGMGNALSAVIYGELTGYYNPALSVFQEGNSFQSSYSFLSLDRSLNFLSFTRKFDFFSKRRSEDTTKPQATAGISIGLINSGVNNIDGRDNQGNPTGPLSTSENQFFGAFSVKITDQFAFGIAAKFYYYKLYEEITANSFGLDFGILYRVSGQLTASLVVSDLNSKYKWDTTPVYGQDGTILEDKFPMLRKIGISYFFNELNLLASAEFENSDAETNIIRAGIEYQIYEGLYIRGGIDQLDLSNSDVLPKPSAGFSFHKELAGFIAGVHYAFVPEQYSPEDRHVVGLSINF
ncbi:MAG: PorV/PorQ family protein [Ignavibacteriaceae bacterium]